MRDHEAQKTAVLDQFERQAPLYAQLVRGAARDQRLLRLIAALQPQPGDRVLDVACGPGKITLALAPLVAETVGIDLTPNMIAEAQRQQAASGVRNAHFQIGDALPLPFDSGRFTLVVTSASLHHVADPAAVVREMARVCAPGGRVAVTDMAPAADKAEAFNASERLRDPSHVRALTLDQLRALGTQAGLSEHVVERYVSTTPLEPVLAGSFPNPEDWPRLRALYQADADSGDDRLGLAARTEQGAIVVSYPMALLVWER
ncbi:MAG: type 11 methyltransferase [Hydrocarboniphaga sp.]|uniref:class I SAM-dependent methyltransferase n=1 Tax=Hydrocarboniphaga sp. TaxID=2033016 RepID=UPI00261B738D|nr:methyltransferase domain-containing protein [Hydrocarboniphaga sp.]MDB5970361.1 type 11 methyltransferase [Hydrocarboniphaga sp.]